jgi:hypothetical protein
LHIIATSFDDRRRQDEKDQETSEGSTSKEGEPQGACEKERLVRFAKNRVQS